MIVGDIGEYKMEKGQREKRQIRLKVLRQRFSVILITSVVVILAGVLAVGSVSLLKKRKQQEAQIVELEKQKLLEEQKKQELKEKEEYYNSDEYIEDVARDKGLAYENEILFKPEQ